MTLCRYCGFETGGVLCGTSNPEKCALAAREATNAARHAADDEKAGRGGFYSGPATPVYLMTRAAITAYRKARRDNESEV